MLWCPDWPVLAHARAERIPPDEPVALVEKGVVRACSASARVEGVRRGMRQREAQARCPALRMLPYDTTLDARAFEPVLAALEATLAGLHPIRPGMVAVRARGPARYYGGERPAALTLLGTVRDLLGTARDPGVPAARVGIADGLFAAERAARWVPRAAPDAAGPPSPAGRAPDPVTIVPPGGAGEFLAPLPVSLLEDPELASLLPRLGIRTLGEFAALDPDDVLARFGPLGARLHGLAAGHDPRAATPRIPPRDVDAVVDFEPPLDRADQVAFGVRAASDRFVQDLLAQKLVCTAVRVELVGSEGESSERVWLHPRSFAAAEVVDRVRWQLEGSELRSPVVRVRIIPDAVDPVGAHERGLWGTGPDEGVHSGFSRVQGMLGHDGVVTAQPSGGRSPAERQVFTPWGDRPMVRRDPARPWPGALPVPRPSTVYGIPRGIAVEDARGRVVAVDDRGRLSGAPAVIVSPTGTRRDLTAWAGPWPIEERWWDAATARSAQRFQVVDTEGEAWLLVLDARGWWAEGRYD